jgi:hypothetical protein
MPASFHALKVSLPSAHGQRFIVTPVRLEATSWGSIILLSLCKVHAKCEHTLLGKCIRDVSGANDVRSSRAQASNLRQRRDQLQHASQNRLAAFGGEGMARLRRMVDQQANSFGRPPLGPIGAYLNMEDTQCALACASG